MTAWYLPLVLFIIFGRLIAPFVVKRMANAPRGRTRRLVWQFSLAALLACLAALLSGQIFEIRPMDVLIVGIIGLANSFACYSQWRAVAISQSRTALYTQGDDLLCLLLGYIVLGEGQFLNLTLGCGVALAVGSAFIYSRSSLRATSTPGEIGDQPILRWIVMYSLIWGVANFSKRYLALDGVSGFNYMAIWYVSSTIGTLFIFKLGSAEERGDPLPSQQLLRLVLPAAATVWTSNILFYWSLALAPITVVQPIDQVSEMVFPFLIGIYIFKEGKKLTVRGRWAMVAGLVGGIIIAFSYN